PVHYLNSRRHRPCPPTSRSNFARDDFRAGCFSRLALKLLPSGLSAGTAKPDFQRAAQDNSGGIRTVSEFITSCRVELFIYTRFKGKARASYIISPKGLGFTTFLVICSCSACQPSAPSSMLRVRRV